HGPLDDQEGRLRKLRLSAALLRAAHRQHGEDQADRRNRRNHLCRRTLMSMNPPSAANLRGAVDLSSLVNRPPASAPAGAAPGAPAQGASVEVPALVVESGDAALQGLVELSNTVPVVLEFHAGQPWGGLADAVRAE